MLPFNAQEFPKLKKKHYWSHHSWARGYFVNTFGFDEEMNTKQVRYQKKEKKRAEDDQ